MLLLSAISVVSCEYIPYDSIFFVYFHHFELTITEYVDEVASTPHTILKVSNQDVTIPYVNASAVRSVVIVAFAKHSFKRQYALILSARSHRKPILCTMPSVESGNHIGLHLAIFEKVFLHFLLRKSFYLLKDTPVC